MIFQLGALFKKDPDPKRDLSVFFRDAAWPAELSGTLCLFLTRTLRRIECFSNGERLERLGLVSLGVKGPVEISVGEIQSMRGPDRMDNWKPLPITDALKLDGLLDG